MSKIMPKILVVGGDVDVIRVLQARLPEHEVISVSERDAHKHILLVDEHRCPMGDYIAELCKIPLTPNEVSSILLHECVEAESYLSQSFRSWAKPDPAARYYHKFTQPYGKDHRNGHRC